MKNIDIRSWGWITPLISAINAPTRRHDGNGLVTRLTYVGLVGICLIALGALVACPTEDDGDRNRLLLEVMHGRSDRGAFYVCCMALLFGRGRFIVAQEHWHGEIALIPDGEGGFGYDPLFYLPSFDTTAANLSNEEKDRLSHRGKAMRRIIAAISGDECLPRQDAPFRPIQR